MQFSALQTGLVGRDSWTLVLLPIRILARSDGVTRTAQHLGFVVVLDESPALSSYDSRTTFSRSPRGSAPRAARGCDWLGSRPHAEELKEQLCCDRGRAARPRELRRKGRPRGGECGPVSRKREEKQKGAQGRKGKGRKGKEVVQAETPASGVWGRLGAASAETLRDSLGRTRGSRRETAPQSVGWRRGTEGRAETNSWRRSEKEAAGKGARAPSSETGEEGQSGSSLKALGEERTPSDASGGDWRANPKGGDEAGGAVERVRHPDRVGGDKNWTPEA